MTHRVKSRPNQTNRESDKLIVRLPEGMRDKIAESAETNGRSMTAEVVAALEQHLKGPSRLDVIEAMVLAHDDRLEAMRLVTSRRAALRKVGLVR